MSHVIRIKPHAYVHILNNNTNCTRLEVGPQTYTRKEHEQLVAGPSPMIMIPPRNYCIIKNPVQRDGDGKVIVDEFQQAKLRYGDQEVRFEQSPFPLYPGEILSGNVAPLKVVAANAALRLRCIRDFDEATAGGAVHHEAGSEWLFEGPGTYKPRVEVQIVEVIRATIVQENQALHVRAKRAMTDSTGKARKAGESWLIRTAGAYLPNVNEEVVGTVHAKVLTDSIALHLRAKRTFTDVFGTVRKAGQEWLVTIEDAETHIPDVYEEVVNTVNITTLNNRQYCVILNPVNDDGTLELGTKKLVVGEKSFFLKPGEQIERGRPQDIHVLGAQDALLLRALEEVKEGETTRKPGDLWMIKGPCEFIPPVNVEIVEARKEIPLDENEGIYVRDMKTGKVTSVRGESYLLKAGEELWEKELPAGVEELLNAGPREKGDRSIKRDKTRVVTYRAPHNSAVQVYDFKANKSRVIFGPDLVMLEPDEQFTVLSLSGGKPKREGQIKSLSILLGPDFMTDIVTVETSDHARLQLQLAYNWHFEVDKSSEEEKGKLFQVPDFVGDVCKAVASRVRGAVAAESFDNFHRHSASIIRTAVFGADKNTLKFQANNLVITNIDVQSVEPIDQRTRDSLQKSVQLAIEITTQSQEAAARHEAERKNQEANGRLERQKIEDEAAAEKARIDLLKLQAETLVLEATGQATADARAKSDAAVIVGESEVSQAEQRAEASNIRQTAALEQLKRRNEAEIEHLTQLTDLEIAKAKKLAEIEAAKFKQTVDAIGTETIKSIASAGPEMQAKLLQGLGLKGFMITDGNSPINLFNTANGLIGGATGGDDTMNTTF